MGDSSASPAGANSDVIVNLVLPSVRLTRIFRQASRSGVMTNAHRINAGEYPQLRGLADFFLFPADDADTAAAVTVDVVTRRIPAKFGLDPRRSGRGGRAVHTEPWRKTSSRSMSSGWGVLARLVNAGQAVVAVACRTPLRCWTPGR